MADKQSSRHKAPSHNSMNVRGAYSMKKYYFKTNNVKIMLF